MRRDRDFGFTLVELLVVVTIIALLVAMLIPSLASVRGLVRETACQENLRQTGTLVRAVEMNTLKSRGQALRFINRTVWPSAVCNLVSQQNIFFCPEAPKGASGGGDCSLAGLKYKHARSGVFYTFESHYFF